MRVAVKLVVEINPEEWRDTHGLDDTRAKTISDDVRKYVLHLVQQSSAIADECSGTVTLAR